jgi:hypothetical protein
MSSTRWVVFRDGVEFNYNYEPQGVPTLRVTITSRSAD